MAAGFVALRVSSMDNSIDVVDTYHEDESQPDRHKGLQEAVELRSETECQTNCSLGKTVAITSNPSIPPESEPLQASGSETNPSHRVPDEGPDESEEEDDSIVLFASRGEERRRNVDTGGENGHVAPGIVYSR